MAVAWLAVFLSSPAMRPLIIKPTTIAITNAIRAERILFLIRADLKSKAPAVFSVAPNLVISRFPISSPLDVTW